LIGEPIALTELSPSELSLEPIRADALILLQSVEIVLHCEFQTDPDPAMPFRMADYALRIFRRFPQKRLMQVVVYLRPTDSELVRRTAFTANRLRHEFEVVRLWDQPTEIFLQRPGLLPYAALSQTSNRLSVLQDVAAAIDAIPDRQQQSNLAAASGVLAGLVLDKQLIQRVLRREIMKESVMYQDLWEEAFQDAYQQAQEIVRDEVRLEVRDEVRNEVRLEVQLEEARSLILRLLTRKVGEVPTPAKLQIEALNLTQLEDLAEALLNFTSLADLSQWFEQLPE
jgi:predicted transposase/invertase (TIGR01784 family)